jgi:hypothetical protein
LRVPLVADTCDYRFFIGPQISKVHFSCAFFLLQWLIACAYCGDELLIDSVKITRIIGAIISIVAATFLAGCHTYQAYKGPALPEQQISIVRAGSSNPFADLKYDQNDIWVSEIDGKLLSNKFHHYHLIKMLPGHHSISFMYKSYGIYTYFTDTPYSMNIHVEAGKKYFANFHREFIKINSPEMKYWIDIVEDN